MAGRRFDARPARRSEGRGRTSGGAFRARLPHPRVRRPHHLSARPGGERIRPVRSGEDVLIDPRMEHSPRAAVPARPDAARFRRAPSASQGPVGRVQDRADEILPREPQSRDRTRDRRLEIRSTRHAVLSSDQAIDPRPGGGVLSRRRPRPGSRRVEARLRRHGGGRRRRGAQARSRHADGARSQGPRLHGRLFPSPDRHAARERRRRHLHPAVQVDHRRRRAPDAPADRRPHELPHDGGPRHADFIAQRLRLVPRRQPGLAAETARGNPVARPRRRASPSLTRGSTICR